MKRAPTTCVLSSQPSWWRSRRRRVRVAGTAILVVAIGQFASFVAPTVHGPASECAWADQKWTGYQEPGKEEKEKGSYPRKEYERHIARPKGRLEPMERQLIGQGCVGLCRVRQGLPGNEQYPDKAPGVRCFLTLGEALSWRCPDCWRLFVFAKQGQWKNKTPATESPVSPDSVEGPYNYATYFPTDGGTWEYMNSNACDAGGEEGQTVSVSGKLPQGKPATIYCSHCVFGWSHPSKPVEGCFSKQALHPLLWEGKVTDEKTGKSHMTPTCPAEPPAKCD